MSTYVVRHKKQISPFHFWFMVYFFNNNIKETINIEKNLQNKTQSLFLTITVGK